MDAGKPPLYRKGVDSPSPALGLAEGLEALGRLLRGRRFVALTGAGLSTESGIPDYRGPTTRHLPRRPIQHREFVERPEARRRYWARSTIGFPRFAEAEPNPGHHALARLEHAGLLAGVITQNVDRLHHRAGSRHVIELHGSLAEVVCLGCGAREARLALQERLLERNPWCRRRVAELRPDGDVALDDEDVRGFVVVPCDRCGGDLMPDVVFFGGSVPRDRVEAAYALVEGAEALLVLGTSLAVYSGLRFPRRAKERGLPVALVNLGETRGDPLCDLRVEARTGEILPALADALIGA